MGRVRKLWVVVGGVSQRRVMVSLSGPLPSPCPLSGHAGLVGGGPVGLRDHDVGVLEERPGAEAVVVNGLGVGLQVALHVLWVEGEVGTQHGRQRGGRGVGQVGRWGHGQRWRQRRGQEARPWGSRQWGHGEGRQWLLVDPVPRRTTRPGVACRVTWPSVHTEESLMRQTGMDDASVVPAAAGAPSSSAHTPLTPLFSCTTVSLLDL